MSCQCGKRVKLCDPCQAINIQPTNILVSTFNPTVGMAPINNVYNPPYYKKKSTSFKKHKSSDSDSSDSCDGYGDNSAVECFSSIQTKYGTISATLTKSANLTTFTAPGQIITYTYNITNTGTLPIFDFIQLYDSKLGTQIIPTDVALFPGTTKTITRTYTTTSNDLAIASITSIASAYIRVSNTKALCTQPVSLTLTYGNANIFGSIIQSITGNTTTVDIFLGNMVSPISQTSAIGVQLTIPLPLGILPGQISGLVGFSPASPPIINGNAIVINEPTIPIGTTYHYRFTVNSVLSGTYTFIGALVTQSFMPSGTNNIISNTISIP